MDMAYDPAYHLPRIKRKRRENEKLCLKEALNRKLWHLYHGLKSKSAEALVGCDAKFLRDHLQSLFVEGMTHENRSKWHIDHIKPCAFFDLMNEQERQKCFHYSNLMPRWAFDNISKKDRRKKMGEFADDIDRMLDNMDKYDPAKKCNNCGAFPLFWLNKKEKWVLIDQKGNIHRCKNATSDPFAEADKIEEKKNGLAN
jgi:hypothetical protein